MGEPWNWARDERPDDVLLLATLSSENDGEGSREWRRDTLCPNMLALEDRLLSTGARDIERWMREDDLREATSSEGRERRSSYCHSGFSGKAGSG